MDIPPPLEGGGWGEGSVRHEPPPPNPLPQGEGESLFLPALGAPHDEAVCAL